MKKLIFNENDFDEYTDELSFAVYSLCKTEKCETSLRVWYDNTNNTYCFQLLIDDGVDVDIVELSHGYVSIDEYVH